MEAYKRRMVIEYQELKERAESGGMNFRWCHAAQLLWSIIFISKS